MTTMATPHPHLSTASLEDGEINEEPVSAFPSTTSSEPAPSISTSLAGNPSASPPLSSPASITVPSSSSTTSTESPPLLSVACLGGCSMTTAELDRAKSLVLDLLGWGVTPEHLIDCGVSSSAIYKIFTDLHLRLPNNLRF